MERCLRLPEGSWNISARQSSSVLGTATRASEELVSSTAHLQYPRAFVSTLYRGGDRVVDGIFVEIEHFAEELLMLSKS